MGKDLQVVLLAVSFVCSGIAGYFLEEVIIKEKVEAADPVVVVDIEEEKSSVPDIQKISPIEKIGDTYAFTVFGDVASGDKLEYLLSTDAECANIIRRNSDGHFENIPGVESERYYIVVKNISTGEKSRISPIEGFKVPVNLVKKLTRDEIDTIMKQGLQAMPKYTGQRISPSHKLNVENLKPDDINPNSVKNIYQKIKSENWKDAIFVNCDYDSENRLMNLTIKVVYPEE